MYLHGVKASKFTITKQNSPKNNFMKKSILKFSALLICASIIFTSCKKTKDADPVDDGSAVAHAGDEAAVNEESDQIADDGGVAMETAGNNARTGRQMLCGADSVVISNNSQFATIYYNNTASCDGKRFRTGVVTVALSGQTSWKTAGAVITVESVNGLRIIRKTDGKSILVKGKHIVTNVSSGTLVELALGTITSLVHEIKAEGMSISFDNGTSRNWEAKRRRTITKNEFGVSVKVEGIMNASGLAATGTNKKGDAFTTIINEALVANSCSGMDYKNPKWNVLSGVKTHTVGGKTVTVTYGYNAAKMKVGSCDANTIKVNYEGPKASVEGFYTYK